MKEHQRYIHELEELHGWLKVDLVHNCFLMGEEVGELLKEVRRYREQPGALRGKRAAGGGPPRRG